tara:strand:+ start:374 stop:598 length:225 start_codon:yes stop_codon:yes gene_type:complete
MTKFTAEDALELSIGEESFTPKGKAVDAIRAAAKEGKTEVSIREMELSDEVVEEFINDGFMVTRNSIIWKEAVA